MVFVAPGATDLVGAAQEFQVQSRRIVTCRVWADMFFGVLRPIAGSRFWGKLVEGLP